MYVLKRSKKFVKKYMYYDSSEYERKDGFNYDDDLKKRIIFFKEDGIKLIAMK